MLIQPLQSLAGIKCKRDTQLSDVEPFPRCRTQTQEDGDLIIDTPVLHRLSGTLAVDDSRHDIHGISESALVYHIILRMFKFKFLRCKDPGDLLS